MQTSRSVRGLPRESPYSEATIHPYDAFFKIKVTRGNTLSRCHGTWLVALVSARRETPATHGWVLRFIDPDEQVLRSSRSSASPHRGYFSLLRGGQQRR
jgi:hypothetical protein